MINFELVCRELGIDYEIGGRNHLSDCVTIRCPICGENPNKPDSKHGNLNCYRNTYKCLRGCEGSSPAMVIAKAGHVPYKVALDVMEKHSDGTIIFKKKDEFAEKFELAGLSKPTPAHKKYLESRGFDVDELISLYSIRFTTMMEKWNGKNWGNRVIIPIKDEFGRIISMQGRDITGNVKASRYMFPKPDQMLANPKNSLYGVDLCRLLDEIVVVEGIMDAWKLGIGAVATYGCDVTDAQVSMMARFKHVVVAFDWEDEAQKHAREIAAQLSSVGVNVEIANTNFGAKKDGTMYDIGDLSMKSAKTFMKHILHNV